MKIIWASWLLITFLLLIALFLWYALYSCWTPYDASHVVCSGGITINPYPRNALYVLAAMVVVAMPIGAVHLLRR